MSLTGHRSYYSLPFQRFYENSIQASNSQAYSPSPFQRFYGNSLQASHLITVYSGKYSQRLLFSELNAVFAATKHFIYFISPILLKRNKEESDPMIGRRRVNVLWYLAYFSSQCVKTTTIDSH